MSKNLLAFVTFGLPEFTKLLIDSIRETVLPPYDIFAIVGKPNDEETKQLLIKEKVQFKSHDQNLGFPYSINDIYDYAWKENNFDNVILMGNDIVLYPNAVNSMIELADSSNYQVISALQYDVRDLIREHPETKQYFSGEDCVFTDFSSRPWESFSNQVNEPQIADMQLYDIQNLCLYKKEVFETIGYTDVNFYPAYFVDNDYARRIVKARIPCCTLTSARFFHFWSRVLKQGSGGSTNSYFNRNQIYYKQKWGGVFGKETTNPPLKISDRSNELATIDYWR